MISFEIITTIERPIEEVFDRLVDIDAYRDWMPSSWLFVETGQATSGPVGAGTETYDRTRLGTLAGVVTDFERPTKVMFRQVLRWRGSTVFESCPGYLLESAGEKTVVRHLAEGRLHGIYRLLEPVVRLMARAERKRTIHVLQASLEAEPSPT